VWHSSPSLGTLLFFLNISLTFFNGTFLSAGRYCIPGLIYGLFSVFGNSAMISDILGDCCEPPRSLSRSLRGDCCELPRSLVRKKKMVNEFLSVCFSRCGSFHNTPGLMYGLLSIFGNSAIPDILDDCYEHPRSLICSVRGDCCEHSRSLSSGKRRWSTMFSLYVFQPAVVPKIFQGYGQG